MWCNINEFLHIFECALNTANLPSLCWSWSSFSEGYPESHFTLSFMAKMKHLLPAFFIIIIKSEGLKARRLVKECSMHLKGKYPGKLATYVSGVFTGLSSLSLPFSLFHRTSIDSSLVQLISAWQTDYLFVFETEIFYSILILFFKNNVVQRR